MRISNDFYKQKNFWSWVGILVGITIFWELGFSEKLWRYSFVFSARILGNKDLIALIPLTLLSIFPLGLVFHLYSLVVWLLFSIFPPFLLGIVLLRIKKVKIRLFPLISTALFIIIIAHSILFAFAYIYKPVETARGDFVPAGIFKSQFFSLNRNLDRTRCRVSPPEVEFVWTVPENGATEVSLHTPVVVRLPIKRELLMREGAILLAEDGTREHVGQTIGATPGTNHIMVPSRGSSDLQELRILRNADQNSVKNYATFGQWKPNTKYTAIYFFKIGNCRARKSFSFTTKDKDTDETYKNTQQYLIPLTPQPSIQIKIDEINLPTLPPRKISIPLQEKIYPTRIEIRQ